MAERGPVASYAGSGMWRSLVAHLLWEQGVAGSNPAIPTTLTREDRLSGVNSEGLGISDVSSLSPLVASAGVVPWGGRPRVSRRSASSGGSG